ncbi:MAG: sugar transferase [Armatimonadetes bacterium]|nr:sugar transferase [Armatimonadota bacterium]
MHEPQRASYILQPEEQTRLYSARRYEALRRTLDLAVAVAGLLLLAPVFALIAVAIKLDSPGPVFYRQRRVGQNRRQRQTSLELAENVVRLNLRRDEQHGQVFWMAKFRTMRADAEAACGPVWAAENDPRVTRVGRFLRRTRLDEIPQLWNVLLGEMSLIGPRPERPEFVSQFARLVDGYTDRLWVKPGITGLAQVRQGYDRDLDDVRRKLDHDREYIYRRSLWMDLAICWATLKVMLVGRGAL